MSENLNNQDDNYIKLFLRIKPKLEKDLEKESNYLTISENKKSLSISVTPANQSKFNFENIFNENESQPRIFDIIGRSLCFDMLKGINSTFISYGKKNTGKSYTIRGKSIHEIQNETVLNGIETEELYIKYMNNKGILNFCLENIFNNIYLNEENKNYEFNVEISYVEIFDNFLFDYFNISYFKENNQFNFEDVFNNRNQSPTNFTKLNISSPDEAFSLLSKADKIKKYIFNEINLSEISGNIIITIYIEKINLKEKKTIKSELNLIEISSDLNIKKNKYNISVKRSIETFSYIINQLSDGVKRENIIYENSLLTNIIKESLGGNAKTSLLINISPYNINMIDSFQTISLGQKMKNIKNNPIINEIIQEKIDFSYYKRLVDKNEGLKNEKNYLIN